MPLQVADRSTTEIARACFLEQSQVPLLKTVRQRFPHRLTLTCRGRAGCNLRAEAALQAADPDEWHLQ
eukprot:14343327-Alexandrium_andersonii.AAC.1